MHSFNSNCLFNQYLILLDLIDLLIKVLHHGEHLIHFVIVVVNSFLSNSFLELSHSITLTHVMMLIFGSGELIQVRGQMFLSVLH